MSVSTFMGLNTAVRGLLTQQRALDVTSHNVTNANTEGYSRQTAAMQATAPLEIAPGHQLGTGVDVTTYKRMRDQFVDLQYRAQAMQVGSSAARSRALDQVELRLAEPGQNGIGAQVSSFFDAWSDLANAPENGAARQALISKASALATSITDLDRGLQTVAQQATDEYTAITASGGELHNLVTELGALNGAIRGVEQSGGIPNDLHDRRDVILDKLSSLAQVSVSDDGAGSIRVTLGGAGAPIVDGSSVTWPPPAMTSPQGKLGALLDLGSPTGSIAAYRQDLAGFAQALTTAVNGQYQTAAGTDFFTYDVPSATLSLASGVTASSLRAGPGATGDNTTARAISELRNQGGPASLYQQLVTRIGTESADAKRTEANANLLADALQDRRESTSGVSLDEEMTNLIRFQRGYQAAARAMSTADEMLDVLINRTGRVGL